MDLIQFESSECSPTSGQLAWHIRRIGGLHTLAEKNRNDVKSVVSRLAPLLSVSSSAVAGLVEEEIKVLDPFESFYGRIIVYC